MAKKFGLWDDINDQLFELGKSTVKQTTKAVQQIIDPTKLAENIFGVNQPSDQTKEQLEKAQSKKPNHTKLDFQKLQKSYNDQDMNKTNILRQRLFQLVKSEEEKTVMKMRQEVVQKKQLEEYQEADKKRKEEEKKKQSAQTAPQGKVRKSIFSAKKVAKREQTEVKPASGKQ